MNILFLTYQGDIAGSTFSIAMLAKGLADKGHSVFMGCRKESLLYTHLHGSKVRLIPFEFKSRFSLRAMRKLASVIKEHKIDIVNAQSSLDRYISIFSRWLLRTKALVFHTRRQMPKDIGSSLKRFLLQKGADGIICVSHSIRNFFLRKKFKADLLHVIWNGTPPETYLPPDARLLEKLRTAHNIQPGEIVLGCVSRRKQQEQIIPALAQLKQKVTFIFVGITADQQLAGLLEQYLLPHRIIFTGQVPVQTARHYYYLFYCKILSSKDEGISQALLSAMAAGVPVIATDEGGNNEIIKDGVNGFLFSWANSDQLAEKLNHLLQDATLHDAFSKAGKKTAFETFSLSHTIRNYENFFGEKLQRKKSSSA